MLKIHNEDEYNDCYGRERMYIALKQKEESGDISIDIPCESTARKVMYKIGLIHQPRRKPNGITKADRKAHKSDDLHHFGFQVSHGIPPLLIRLLNSTIVVLIIYLNSATCNSILLKSFLIRKLFY